MRQELAELPWPCQRLLAQLILRVAKVFLHGLAYVLELAMYDFLNSTIDNI